MLIRKCWLLFLSLSVLLMHKESEAAPIKKDRFYYEKKGEMIWEVQTDRKIIALTFDDGPDKVQTSQILDLLEKYDARGTFFVVGSKVGKNPEIMKRMADNGHEIANHTYNHVYFNPPASAQRVEQEITLTEKEIFLATGKKSVLFRPPGGIYDETIVQVSNRLGLMPVMWSWHQDTNDWRKPGARKIRDQVLRNARNGDIVLLHDHVRGKSQTIAALEMILPVLQERGYRLVTVSELIRSSMSKEVRK